MATNIQTERKAIDWRADIPESFRFATFSWDVRKAKQLLLAKKRVTVEHIDVDAVEKLLARKLSNGSIRMGVSVDWDAVKRDCEYHPGTYDVTFPIILARAPGDEKTYLPIDGYHRIAKASLREDRTLPAVLLSMADSRACRLR